MAVLNHLNVYKKRAVTVRASRQKVTGVIVPTAWTDDGDITRIAIFTIDEKEYQIDLEAKGRELMHQINARVELEGRITPCIDGRWTIAISNYTLLDTNTN